MQNDVRVYAKVTLRHEGTDYTFTYPHPYRGKTREHAEAGMRYLWTEGNYGCDCNRFDFITVYCNVELVPEGAPGWLNFPCGDTIELVSLEAVDDTEGD